MLKILALHGYSVNGTLFRRKMSAIRKLCAADCEIVFADGPILLAQADMEGFQSDTTSAQLIRLSETTPELAPRAWWRANADKTVYMGAEDSVDYIKELVRTEGPFDGVFGFSQGAGFAGLLCAMLERPHLYPRILVDGAPPQPPFKFGIFVSGFRPLDATLATVFSEGLITTPTLHIMGNNDFIVGASRSQTLLDACENPRLEKHDGGHFVPSAAPWRHFFKEYIRAFGPDATTQWEDVVSPNAPAKASM